MMYRPIGCLLLTLLVSTSPGQTPKNAPAAKTKPPASFTERLLKFLGISDSPGTLKGPGDEVRSGELWVADVRAKTTHALTHTDGYRSPIFLAGSMDVLALRGSEVIRIPSTGGEGKSLYSVDGIVKLVGAGSEDAAKVLILLRGEAGHSRVAVLTVSTGEVAAVAYDPASSQDLQMVEALAGWSRTYGDRHIYMQKQNKPALSGTVEWHDVFLQVDRLPPVDVSRCDGDNCGQPSLSPDGHSLVFVKTRTD
ncbi:MAG TPA: hypothetical protein VIW68_14920 [Candidatus Sulfotelmatobacter sp.]